MTNWQNRIISTGEEQPDQLLANPANWRIHPKGQQEALEGVLSQVGWVQQVIVNKRTGNLVDGHLRVTLALRHNEKSIPVNYIDVSPEEEALILATLDPIAGMAAADKDKLDALLRQVQSDDKRVQAMLTSLAAKEGLYEFSAEQQKEAVEKGKDDTNIGAIDVIYTANSGQGGNGQPAGVLTHCCLAIKSGWLYGFRSSDSVCATVKYQPRHRPIFIDNEFKFYDHQLHQKAVAQYKPKYATVRDLMTKDQCKAAGIEYFDFDTIMTWAEDLRQYAENVIIIPKYDCLADIPLNYVLGYSIPTSYGGTPLPIQMFRGRRVHLLGGSPNKQITYWNQIPDDVVSLDNNYVYKLAHYGMAWCMDGKTRSLTELGFGLLTNPLHVALAISLGNFAAYFRKEGEPDAQIQYGEISEAE